MKTSFWIHQGFYDSGYKINVSCPKCNKIISGSIFDFKFCPYCGSNNGLVKNIIQIYEKEEEEEDENV